MERDAATVRRWQRVNERLEIASARLLDLGGELTLCQSGVFIANIRLTGTPRHGETTFPLLRTSRPPPTGGRQASRAVRAGDLQAGARSARRPAKLAPAPRGRHQQPLGALGAGGPPLQRSAGASQPLNVTSPPAGSGGGASSSPHVLGATATVLSACIYGLCRVRTQLHLRSYSAADLNGCRMLQMALQSAVLVLADVARGGPSAGTVRRLGSVSPAQWALLALSVFLSAFVASSLQFEAQRIIPAANAQPFLALTVRPARARARTLPCKCTLASPALRSNTRRFAVHCH